MTVYAHFPTLQHLLEALLERSVRAAATTMAAAKPDSGPPDEALDRLLSVGWQALARASALARVTSEQLSADKRRKLHEPAFAHVYRLIERCQRGRVFRGDVPAEWLVACSYALMHAAADDVRAGRLDAASAPKLLRASLHRLIYPERSAAPRR